MEQELNIAKPQLKTSTVFEDCNAMLFWPLIEGGSYKRLQLTMIIYKMYCPIDWFT